jgi:methionyl-tRNA formyltransferase
MDAGPIYLQQRIAVAAAETTESLQARLTPIGAQLLLETIRRLKELSLEETPQSEADATFAPLIKKTDGLLDWKQPAVAIERRIRGFTPWPSAFTYHGGKLLKVHRAKVTEATTGDAAPGEIVRADDHGFWVATGDGVLSLEEVQLEGRRRVTGIEFVRGARIMQGERF